MIGRKKKETKHSLYKGYLEAIKAEQASAVSLFEKESGKRKIELPYTLSICSLKEGCGCSHLSLAIAAYLEREKESVYIVTKSLEAYKDTKIPHGESLVEYRDYQHIIFDFGCIRDLEFQELQEIKRCEKKLMLCILSDIYLMKLARFIEKELAFTRSWYFLFNFVPESRKFEVEELMEDYPHTCLPLFYQDDTKITANILEGIWSG